MHPLRSPPAGCDRDRLIEVLRELGLVGDNIDQDDFAAGPGFLDYISFLGCSPQVILAMAEDRESGGCGREGAYIHIPRETSAHLLVDANARPPRCPQCHKVDADWRRQWLTVQAAEPVCGHCGTASPAERWQWGRGGGWVGLHAGIVGLHPEETVPSHGLVEAIAESCGGEWRTFYLVSPMEGANP